MPIGPNPAAIPDDAVVLVDAGDGRRLDRLGSRLVDRPHPAAADRRRASRSWSAADLFFDRRRGWSGPADPAEAWIVEPVSGIRVELRATASGGVGLYPEQLANAAWLAASVERRIAAGTPQPAVLNLFAHTGLLTLVAALAGAAVTHVDGSRGAVAWGRRNAELSELADRPIRWIVDDALGFVEREARRGRRYDGFVVDPPSYGHGAGRAWRIEADLAALLTAGAAIAGPDPFVLVSAHTTGLDADWLAGTVSGAFPNLARRIDVLPLELEAESGARLALGLAVRASR